MLRFSGLEQLIKSVDEDNNRKTGQTEQKDRVGGRRLPHPVRREERRQAPVGPDRGSLPRRDRRLPDTVGKDGDPIKLSADRTAAYESSRKIVDISTPLIRGQSKIYERFLRGDQRYYFVRCLKCNARRRCGGAARTRKRARSPASLGDARGEPRPRFGPLPLPECGHPHVNDDKVRLLSPEHGAEWRPTAVPVDPHHRSYHLSALYSPPACVVGDPASAKWLEAWDSRARASRGTSQSSRSSTTTTSASRSGCTGSSVVFEAVSSHRRAEYHFGQIPNRWAPSSAASPVLVVCTVDVHGDNLAVSVIGWCRDRASILVDYWRFEGNTERLDDRTRGAASESLIETKVYVADDGKTYRIQL
jgi:hypothetical protein